MSELQRYRATVGNKASDRREWVYLCVDVDEVISDAMQQAREAKLFKVSLAEAVDKIVTLEAEAQALREEVAALRAKLAMAEDASAKGDAARQQCGGMEMEIEELRAEIAALRARAVVVPERLTNGDSISRMLREIGCDGDVSYHHAREIWNACLDELARLNGKTVSEGLLRLTLEFIMATNYKGSIPLGLIEELRALLNQDKENGNG
ncbi:hypothetical protein [Pseudomonas aeruginosa]|uniref:hypothetical protein n=1 Tax=Pseudomonas aeruginosa TaxID=287 RepID=UPI00071C0E54|nr:hypothetical protein [Pseudomonas aeruginosa]KSE46662.1 hypothetical protein AO921_05500 [Pseudomonas aeruginosa]NPW01311.1 hypothetical protein [Pseudomonas aeruginosa]OVY92686.1 hypothetical protein CDO42_27770 [Pseudomonas aeruginosa]RPO48269.1 hypothetical protein IPC1191_01580 [Pseudomonas aeruginosa]RPO59557.1 hypothetical protein IPC1190_01580 [Pseudomonas aeruginosa]